MINALVCSLHESRHGHKVIPAQAGVVACLAVSSKAPIAVSVHWLAGRAFPLKGQPKKTPAAAL